MITGYENEEQVETASLSRTHGKNTRGKQKREAEALSPGYLRNSEELTHLDSAMQHMYLNASQYGQPQSEKIEGGDARNSISFEDSSCGNGPLAVGRRPQEGIEFNNPGNGYATSSQAGKARPISVSKKSFPKMFMPPLPTSFTSINEGQNCGKGDIPSLLMAWYMTGYHSGYFDAKQDLRKKNASTAAAKRAHGQ